MHSQNEMSRGKMMNEVTSGVPGNISPKKWEIKKRLMNIFQDWAHFPNHVSKEFLNGRYF